MWARLAGIGLAGTLLAAGGWFVAGRLDEARRLEGGERRLRIAPADATVVLYRAGATLDDAVPVPVGPGDTWLAEGDYFAEAHVGLWRLYYPVSVRAAREGPDADGTFQVTLRPISPEPPPRLDDDEPPYALVPAGPFEMGDRTTPRGPHYAFVSTFFLRVFETTNREFRRFLSTPDGYDDRETGRMPAGAGALAARRKRLRCSGQPTPTTSGSAATICPWCS